MNIELDPIGFVRTDSQKVPRHWSVSDLEGDLAIDERYARGLKDITVGQRIVVIFLFHRSPKFHPDLLTQWPPHQDRAMGVFSICSPYRPNPIGMSVLEVLDIEGGTLHVKGLDMIDGTPILDIKPYVVDKATCPSYERKGNPEG
ncbi:MAG: tRNA (N6-threonylcarbamoyladenosine(37)-N6)-methyltransferase TrmO [Deltaproteobacteria bacterium]|nr:tRNA (N6-threonylcarbamoyladenosine(37)-N6)-methyltransferase TrmO [Deltaproteobacteria bacterium]